MKISGTKLLTYEEVAEFLRCDVKTVYNLVKKGDIQPCYVGRLVRFTEECILEFLQRKSKAPNEQAEA